LTRDYIRSRFRILDRESHEVDIHGNSKVFLNSLIGIVENGKLVRTWGIQRDVTEKVKLEESHRKAEEALRESESHFRLLVEQASDGIFLADAQGRYIDVNSAGAEMLGYSRTEILRLSIADIVAAEEVPRIPDEVARFAGGSVVRTETCRASSAISPSVKKQKKLCARANSASALRSTVLLSKFSTRIVTCATPGYSTRKKDGANRIILAKPTKKSLTLKLRR